MKKIAQKILILAALCMVSVPLMAQSTHFVPTPVGEEEPLRVFIDVEGSTYFSGGDTRNPPVIFAQNHAFNLMSTQLNLGLVYNVGMGLDMGFGIYGGVFSPYGFFRDTSWLVSPYSQYGLMLGADMMVRYLAMLGDLFYGGVQVQAGYNYTNLWPGAPDDQIKKLGFSSSFAAASAIPVIAGLVVGADFAGAAQVYLFPAVELGQTPNQTDLTQNSSPDTGIWKSAIGMQIAAGAVFDLGGTHLVLEAKPHMANFSNKYSLGLDANLGMFWNF